MPDTQADKIPGIERAAILLLSLGEQEATAILKHMEPREVQKVGMAMAALENIPREKVTSILSQFVDSVENQTALGGDSRQYIRNILTSAIGPDKASGLINRIMQNTEAKGLDTLKWMDAKSIADMIQKEHPQIIAIVLAYLDGEQAAEVLELFPEPLKVDVIMRVATLDGIPPSALKELNDVMEKQFSGKSGAKASGIGGIKTASGILNFMDSAMNAELISKIRETDDALGTKLEDNLFIFEDILKLDNRNLQLLLREVSSDALLLSLKGSSEALKDKIFSNMSSRAAEMLKDDLDAKGPVRLSEVEAAQKEILGTVRKLASTGEIVLGGSGGEALV